MPTMTVSTRSTHRSHPAARRPVAPPARLFHVALTGNIAAGKSAVTRLLRDWGATIIDADEIVRQLQQPGTPVFHAIVERFGPSVLTPEGTLDRGALRARILASPEDKSGLEGIVHPAVQAERERLLQSCRRGCSGVVVSDIPLLFEVMDPAGFDAVVLVDAPEPMRFDRLVRERGLPEAEARALLSLQLPTGPKRLESDHVIDNDGSRETLRDRAWTVWRKLVSEARARLTPT
jgi:dephospho-CoA kinase